MRVVFMGTPQIAADCLSRLIADGFDLVGVYTKPDMPKNRGMKRRSAMMPPWRSFAPCARTSLPL